jgi:hypothetical protein
VEEEPLARGSVSVFDLVQAVSTILKRYGERTDVREIQADPYTVSEKIDLLRQMVASRPRFRFSELFAAARSRAEVVVTFLALLELIRMKQLVCVQTEDFGEIEVEPMPPADPANADAGGLVPAPEVVSDLDEPENVEPAATETGPGEGLPPGAMPPADFVVPVEPPPPGTLPPSIPWAEGSGGPLPA